MLTSRLPTVLRVSETLNLVRFHIAGNKLNCSLRAKKITLSRNGFFFTRNISHMSKRDELTSIVKKRNDVIARPCHAVSDYTSERRWSENSFSRDALVNSERAFKTLFIPLNPTTKLSEDEIERILSENWENFKAEDMILAFEKLSGHAKLTCESLHQDKYRHILLPLAKQLRDLDDEKLFHVIRCLALWEKTTFNKNSAYTKLWMELDQECINRLRLWTADQALLMCDHWYQLGLCRAVNFPKAVLKKLGRKPNQLSPPNFLHFMFIINTCRKSPVNMYEVEYALDGKIDQYTANELGIVSMGFFKSQNPIRDHKLISKMHFKIMENLEAVHDINISAIMKITRYSTGLKELEVFEELLKRLKSRIPDLSIPCLTNIAHAAAFVQSYNPEVMELLLERFERDIDAARIKDLERLSWVLTIFNYDPATPIYRKIVDSLRDPKRSAELYRFPKILPTTLCHLSSMKILPKDLIAQCFDADFLNRVYGNNPYKIGWNYFILENNIRIEMPEYDGPFLKPCIMSHLAKKFVWSEFLSQKKVSPADQFVLDVTHVCMATLNSETAAVISQILPHYVKPDIVLCLDEKNNPVDPQAFLSSIPPGTIKYLPAEVKNVKYFAIILATQNQMIRRTDRYGGPLDCKIRQLDKLGYTPIVVNMIEWRELVNLEAKKNYIRNKLQLSTYRSVSAAAL